MASGARTVSGTGVAASGDTGDGLESESKLIMSFMDSVQTTISAAMSSELLVESRWREPFGAAVSFPILGAVGGFVCLGVLVSDDDDEPDERVGRLR